LKLLAVSLVDEADVKERHHLTELHRGALHRPEHGNDLLSRLNVAAGQRLVAGLLATRDVRGARGKPLGSGFGANRPIVAERPRREVGMSSRATRSTPTSPQPARFTREPGTMSSVPSGQRTQALCPPS